MATGFYYHSDCENHITGHGHPERPERLTSIKSQLEASGTLAKLEIYEPQPIDLKLIELVHPASHIEKVKRACDEAPVHFDEDTAVSEGSWRAALLAAGAVTQACNEVMAKRLSNAFCAIRPPGHHAETNRPMGFCLFNNVAIAARHLQKHHGIKRVAIFDWDVHHGNGTQEIFAGDESVMYLSTHQFPFYPGTGSLEENKKNIINVPLDIGAGDGEMISAFQRKLLPAAREFAPDFILISAGFDAHRDDPLAQLNLSSACYGAITKMLMELANRSCEGRIVSALEGGYNLTALAQSVERHLEALAAF